MIDQKKLRKVKNIHAHPKSLTIKKPDVFSTKKLDLEEVELEVEEYSKVAQE